MASGKITTFQNSVIDHYTRNVADTGPHTAYLALYSVAPTEDSAGTELTGNGYARIAAGFTAASGGTTANAGTVTFTASGGAWSQIVGHGLLSATTAGTLLYWEDSVTGPTLADGDSYQFGIGDITLAET